MADMNESERNEENTPIQLEKRVLSEYSWLQSVTLTRAESFAVSALIINNRSVKDSIPNISSGRPTMDVEAVSAHVLHALNSVRAFAGKDPQFQELIERESQLLDQSTAAIQRALGGIVILGIRSGGKKRVNDVYR